MLKPDALLLLPIFGRFGGLPRGKAFGPEKKRLWAHRPRPLAAWGQRLRTRRCLPWCCLVSPREAVFSLWLLLSPQLCKLKRPQPLPRATQSVPSLQLLVLIAQADSMTAPNCFPNIPERSFPVFFLFKKLFAETIQIRKQTLLQWTRSRQWDLVPWDRPPQGWGTCFLRLL